MHSVDVPVPAASRYFWMSNMRRPCEAPESVIFANASKVAGTKAVVPVQSVPRRRIGLKSAPALRCTTSSAFELSR